MEGSMGASKSPTKTLPAPSSERPAGEGFVISDSALDDVTGGAKHIGGVKYEDTPTTTTSTTTTPTK
jgi:hypothetical protein